MIKDNLRNPLSPGIVDVTDEAIKVDRDLATLYLIYDLGNKNNRLKEVSIKVLPDSLSYSYSPNFNSQNLLGRLSPIYMYTGGSAKTYSFSIDIHEDILDSTQFSSIQDFVDTIKSFSYPVLRKDGQLELPQIYFQLGELSGYGLIKTSIRWNKPLRNGKYVYATISFSITIERKIPQAKLDRLYSSVDGENIVYSYNVVSNLSKVDYYDTRNILKNSGYDVNASDFITFSDNDDLNKARREYAQQQFNMQIQRLDNIFGAFANYDDSNGYREKAAASYKTEDFEDLENLYTVGNDDADAIREAKQKFDKFIDYYYENVDLRMTPEEKQLIRDTVYNILENLQIIAEEIRGYGASN